MASATLCRNCLYALQHSRASPSTLRRASRSPHVFRSLSTSSFLFQKPPSTPKTQTKGNVPSTSRAPSGRPEGENATNESQSANTTLQNIAAETRRVLPTSVTETYVAYGSCEKLVKESAKQAAYTIPQASDKGVPIPKTQDGEDLGVGESWWYQTLGLTPTFNTWAQITFLHMYLLTVRMRCFPAQQAPTWHQHLLDQFFYTAEDKMVQLHNVHSRAIRNKYLKDLYVQWRGLLAGYDEGLVSGDAVLATAVWRNVFKADENVDVVGLGQVISYMRGVLKGLDAMSDDAIASGEVVFGNPSTEKSGVLVKSTTMATLNDRIEGEFEQLSAAPG